MDRANSKHSQHLDDQMEREVRGQLQGSPAGGRVEEWREPEPSGEDEPDVSAVPRPDRAHLGDAPVTMTDEEIEARSRLGTYLPRSVFPADRDALIEAARQTRAPDGVIADLQRLPPDATFETVVRVWGALGHPIDTRF